MKTALHLLPLLIALGAAPARADDDEGADDSMASRHVFELEVSAGGSGLSDAPERIDPSLGGALGARVAVDVVHARADVAALMPDPTTPDRFMLRGDARLLFVTVHDFTWRRSDAGELIRLFAGLGGDIDLPENVGHIMLNAGFAMVRLGSMEGGSARQLSEAYGAYAGLTARLHFWEIRDELRVAVHGLMPPPELTPELALAPETLFDALVGGVTISNRFYLQVLREGVISAGPELVFHYEQLLEGPVVLATLGVAGTLGI